MELQFADQLGILDFAGPGCSRVSTRPGRDIVRLLPILVTTVLGLVLCSCFFLRCIVWFRSRNTRDGSHTGASTRQRLQANNSRCCECFLLSRDVAITSVRRRVGPAGPEATQDRAGGLVCVLVGRENASVTSCRSRRTSRDPLS